MSDEMSAELSAELVQVLWETLAELYGSASVYPCDDIRRMAHDITTLRAERDALKVNEGYCTELCCTAQICFDAVVKQRDALRAELAAEREAQRAGMRALGAAEDFNKELMAERDALRANLRDELERADAWHKTFLQTQKHNDELRALLREAREYVADMPIVGDVLLDRIDAALKGDDRD